MAREDTDAEGERTQSRPTKRTKTTVAPSQGGEKSKTSSEGGSSRLLAAADHDATSQTPPKYGEQGYWETRYQRLLDNKEKKGSEPPTGEDDQAPLPYHCWYFSYNELRPLLLPIILGARPEAQQLLSGPGDGEELENVSNGASDNDNDNNNNTDAIEIQNQDEDKEEIIANSSGDVEEDGEEDIGDDHDDGEFVEISGDDDDDDDDEEVDRGEGLACNGPIVVVEIGCGDVPLGTGLAKDLNGIQEMTGVSAKNIVEKIICLDYSASVIQKMKEDFADLLQSGDVHQGNKGDEKGDLSPSIPLEFSIADARQLELGNESVNLVVEKGTLDAMISDAKEGKKNAIQTVSECARVLKCGGCFVLISHSNAHTEHGMAWLQDVVFVGLQREGASEANIGWEIEVHGNDEASTLQGEKEESQDSGPGPAVYIIHKTRQESAQKDKSDAVNTGETESTKAAESDEAEQPSEKPLIPVRFYTY